MLNYGHRALGKWTFGSSRRNWENIEMYGREIICEDVKLMELVQDRIQWCAFVLAELTL
jgi:hypothetical protein